MSRYTYKTVGVVDNHINIETNMPQEAQDDLNKFLKYCGGYSPKDDPEVVIPAARLCPNCFMEIVLDPDNAVDKSGHGCKHVTCPNARCKTTFCFGCLSYGSKMKCDYFGNCKDPVRFQKLVPQSSSGCTIC